MIFFSETAGTTAPKAHPWVSSACLCLLIQQCFFLVQNNMLGSLFYYNKGYTKVYNICEGQIKLVMALTSQNSNDLHVYSNSLLG